MSASPDTPGCHPQLLEATGDGVVGGGVEGWADRGELWELGQVVEDGVEGHRAQEVAARVLLSIINNL